MRGRPLLEGPIERPCMSNWTGRAEECAKAKGLEVHRPAETELFVDIDDAASLATFRKALPLLGDLVVKHALTPSPSGKTDRFHARVQISRAVHDAGERCALQSILGSDLLHEALSYVAALHGVASPTVFFEKPGFTVPYAPMPCGCRPGWHATWCLVEPA